MTAAIRAGNTLVLCALSCFSQTWQGNHDESKVKPYKLPDPLVMKDGTKVTSARQWTGTRRPEILGLFEEHVYGRTPASDGEPRFEQVSIDRKALGGKAVRKQVTISFPGKTPRIHVLMYLPADTGRPAPVFVGLSFTGNHSVHADPGIALNDI